jgi:hypothetical protein
MERRRGNSRKDNRRGGNYREENKNNQAAVYRPKPKKNQTTETGFTGGPDTWFDGKYHHSINRIWRVSTSHFNLLHLSIYAYYSDIEIV